MKFKFRQCVQIVLELIKCIHAVLNNLEVEEKLCLFAGWAVVIELSNKNST